MKFFIREKPYVPAEELKEREEWYEALSLFQEELY